jgi:hypothetical protein
MLWGNNNRFTDDDVNYIINVILYYLHLISHLLLNVINLYIDSAKLQPSPLWVQQHYTELEATPRMRSKAGW